MKVAGITLALASAALAQSNLPTLQEVLMNNTQLSQLANLAAPYLSTLASASNITVLAPNNAAVGKFLNSTGAAAALNDTALVAALLQYHVLQGNNTAVTNLSFIPSTLMAGNYANVTGGQVVEAIPGTDGSFSLISGLLQNSTINGSAIQFQGGVLHVLNEFLTLPQNLTTTAVALNLTSAVGAISELNLSMPLASMGDLTYFIPNNAAFQRIGGNLANMSMANLTSILEYHVVAAGMPLYSTAIMNDTSYMTLAGSNVTIRIEGEDVYVNAAKVTVPNVLVSNGVVHVIDAVLNPSNTTAMPNTATTADSFPSATSASNVPFTSGIAGPSSAVATQSAPNASGSAKSSSGAAWQPAATGAMGMGALFGGAAIVMNM